MGRMDLLVFDDLLREEREFPPPKGFQENAVIRDRGLYEKAAADRKSSGRTRRNPCTGSPRGQRCSTGTRRMRAGSSGQP